MVLSLLLNEVEELFAKLKTKDFDGPELPEKPLTTTIPLLLSLAIDIFKKTDVAVIPVAMVLVSTANVVIFTIRTFNN